MLIEILRELFRPPYDLMQILMIILLVIFALYICGVIISLFHRCIVNQKVRRFFSAHKAASGVIIKYDTDAGDTYVIASPVVPGQMGLLVPHIYETADQYMVVLECRTDDAHFYALYQIPLSDYKEEKEGETVRIKDSWIPIGYEEI